MVRCKVLNWDIGRLCAVKDLLELLRKWWYLCRLLRDGAVHNPRDYSPHLKVEGKHRLDRGATRFSNLTIDMVHLTSQAGRG